MSLIYYYLSVICIELQLVSSMAKKKERRILKNFMAYETQDSPSGVCMCDKNYTSETIIWWGAIQKQLSIFFLLKAFPTTFRFPYSNNEVQNVDFFFVFHSGQLDVYY